MPDLVDHIKTLHIIARPMRAPLTFKTSVFQREFKQYRNLISVGDGNAERTASLRLQMAPDVQDGRDQSRSVKSVKLIELPTCQQLFVEHEMLQQRLAEIVSFRGHLDLKSRFAERIAGQSFSHPMGKIGMCSLVHFSRPLGAPACATGGAWPSHDDTARMQGVISLRTLGPGSRAGESSGTGPGSTAEPKVAPSVPAMYSPAGSGIHGVRALRRDRGSGKNTPEPPDSPPPSGALDRSKAEDRSERVGSELDGGTNAADSLLQVIGNVTREAVEANNKSVTEEQLPLNEQRGITGDGLGSLGGRSSTPPLSGQGLWKVQGERSTVRSPPFTNKKRPIMGPGMGARSPGAVWRESSAPAGTRSF
jgi:hypothetical protein